MHKDFRARRQQHFDALYKSNPDPWNYCSSDYERDKYAATLAALPLKRFRSVIEVGCSIGVLTGLLADRADTVTGIDLSEQAIALARSRLSGRPSVNLVCGTVPADWPEGSWDLFILSEVLYYLSKSELDDLARQISASAIPGAHCILVNWTGDAGTSWRGPEAAEAFVRSLSCYVTTETSLRSEAHGFVIERLILA